MAIQLETSFPRLILRLLGIYRGERFTLGTEIQPVSLVDADISIPATVSPVILGTPATAGDLVAPVANFVLADTGELTAGDWNFTVQLGTNDANNYEIQRRNSTNTANVWAMRLRVDIGSGPVLLPLKATMLTNERLRVQIMSVGTAGTVHRANIFSSL